MSQVPWNLSISNCNAELLPSCLGRPLFRSMIPTNCRLQFVVNVPAQESQRTFWIRGGLSRPSRLVVRSGTHHKIAPWSILTIFRAERTLLWQIETRSRGEAV